ncbi:segregation and condensation protein B [Enterococcus moraviensis ATCC BAA-383]|uniref:Segregation and condensation protein B n=1 Tax=Enterococcus moraviensis ATCC BAA-383 TaxID=1158609 RepID=R2T690_9ENTE|nr:SMC-Scp complex subunit ScpB [Enterococcus moraviensis]EOI00509.1 segregation and condensation protein B [Enterococcus moraviensis ATCC BAA-383]EOT73262.1 segregation and condensation protein B [Enterococcus moraviensis ATCC BAA-383]
MTTVSQIEAILFVVGEEGIGLEELSYLLGLSTAKTYESLIALKERYESDKQTALNILEVGNHFILSTKKTFAPLLKKYAQSPISNALSQAALETLSIVAYKQPISRVEVDEIRGVQSAGSMQKLVARQLIEEKGRVDGPGRAILYGTTAYFMDYFGLKSLEELPDIHQMEEEIAEELPLDLFFDRYKELNEEETTIDSNESEEEN